MSLAAMERNESASPVRDDGEWGRRGAALLISSALALLYGPLGLEMTHKWLSDEYSAHGLFIPFMVVLLLWWKRAEIARTPRVCSAWGLPVLGAGLALQVLAWHARMPLFAAMSLVPTLLGLTLTLAGRQMLRLLWFPVVFLVFATPLPRWVVQPLSLPI